VKIPFLFSKRSLAKRAERFVRRPISQVGTTSATAKSVTYRLSRGGNCASDLLQSLGLLCVLAVAQLCARLIGLRMTRHMYELWLINANTIDHTHDSRHVPAAFQAEGLGRVGRKPAGKHGYAVIDTDP
jgi:hypothetical protein